MDSSVSASTGSSAGESAPDLGQALRLSGIAARFISADELALVTAVLHAQLADETSAPTSPHRREERAARWQRAAGSHRSARGVGRGAWGAPDLLRW